MSVTTVSSSMITDATILNADIGASAAIAQSKLAALASANMPAGSVVQVVNAVTTARVTGTTTATQDDTIPQNSEGVEMLTLAITPTNASNKLVIIVNMSASHTYIQANIVMALFQDSTANAIAAIMHNSQKLTVAQRPVILHMDHFMAAGTTSATTFKVRIGSLSGGTIDINSAAGARLWGGVSSATIRIMEIKV